MSSPPPRHVALTFVLQSKPTHSYQASAAQNLLTPTTTPTPSSLISFSCLWPTLLGSGLLFDYTPLLKLPLIISSLSLPALARFPLSFPRLFALSLSFPRSNWTMKFSEKSGRTQAWGGAICIRMNEQDGRSCFTKDGRVGAPLGGGYERSRRLTPSTIIKIKYEARRQDPGLPRAEGVRRIERSHLSV